MESFQLNFTIDETYLDKAGRVRPGALLYFAQEAAGTHCGLLGASNPGNLFWAVIRHRVQITRLPEKGETITVKTWPMPTTRTCFPRVCFCYDHQGKELFSVISLWVLMDKTTRAMVLPGKSGVDVPGVLKGCEPDAPGSILPRDLPFAGVRQVSREDLDGNLHMNNTRYLDWAWELLPECWAVKTPREISVCYLSETRQGQELALFWGETDPEKLQFEGLRPRAENPEKQERVFAVSVKF
ncbi:MAG: hypothetical protein IJW41_05320 [Oscillospiraceae bacterium]|nr:hypothetical protein [Oscillospiraceae bacterium]MBQ7341569.1 hypothetical protein [Oscillospiraceae bacterium]